MKTLNTILIAVFSLTVLIGCGGEKEKEKEGFTIKKEESKSASKAILNTEKEAVSNLEEVSSSPNEVVISGDDLMRFDKSEIKVKAGRKVKLTLRHKGKLDVSVMGHNFVLLKKGVDVAAFAGKAVVANNNQYIPVGSQDIIVHTSLVGAGQTTTIVFDAPEVGTYDFICSFPGHYAMMKGKFIVE